MYIQPHFKEGSPATDSRNKIPIKSLLKQQYQQIIEGNLQKVGMIKTLERLMYLMQ